MTYEYADYDPAMQHRYSLWRRLLRLFARLVLGFMLVSVLLVAALRWLPAPISGVMIERAIEARLQGKPGPQGKGGYKQWVDWNAISAAAPLAAIAAEDQRFLEHYGFDLPQIEKALEASRRGKRLRGASTITQQTAKNLFLWGGRSFIRKGLEAWFTVLIEILWPKQRILEMYLNIVEFGPGIYGVEAASRNYFRKPAKQLNRYEAALLAAVLPNPHKMHVNNPSPYVRERQQWIARQMGKLGGEALIRSLAR